MTRSGHLLRMSAAMLPNTVPHIRAMDMARRPTLQDMGKDSDMMLLISRPFLRDTPEKSPLKKFLDIDAELHHEGVYPGYIWRLARRWWPGREPFSRLNGPPGMACIRKKCDCAYYEYGENCKQEALDDVFCHILPSFLSYYFLPTVYLFIIILTALLVNMSFMWQSDKTPAPPRGRGGEYVDGRQRKEKSGLKATF